MFNLITIGIIAAAVLVGIVVLAAIMLRRVVPTNMVHIVQSSKKTTSYGRGREAGNTYYEWPAWIPFFGVTVSKFPESVFDISLRDYEAYDIGRLPFVADIQAFFRISDSQVAAQRVASFDELKGQLVGVLQGAVRSILGTNKLEEIMHDRSTLGGQFTKEVDDQLREWGVCTVKSIEFMDIRDSRDSQVIHDIMSKEKSRIERESRIAVAENHQAAETKEIEAKRSIDINRIEAEQQVGLRDAQKEQAVGIAKEQSTQEVQSEAKVTTERQMEVRKVAEVKQAEIARDVAVVKAEADKNVAVVEAQAEKEATIQIAEGKLDATKKDSEGVLALGNAKAEAEKAMLLAPVNAQLTLAKEIGENQGYQSYLIEIRKIEAGEGVGKEMAGAMKSADLKVIANSGDVQGGIGKLGDLFTPAGGTSLSGMLAAFAQTEEGKALVDGVTSKLTGPTVTPTRSNRPKTVTTNANESE